MIEPSLETPLQQRPAPLTIVRDETRLELALTPQYDEGWNLGLDYADTRVGTVKRNGPAADAGLKAGDVITALDGQPVHASARSRSTSTSTSTRTSC